MLKKVVIANSLMSVVILFAILFQSVHSYEHLSKQLTEKKCLHKSDYSKNITHKHNTFDKCFVCEFAFSSAINNPVQSFVFSNDCQFFKTHSYFLKESIPYFSGISYSLRGSPTV